MAQITIFLDDGGVMNDNASRGTQWQAQVSDFFPPLLGGKPQAWKEANRIVIDRMLDPSNWQARLRAASDIKEGAT